MHMYIYYVCNRCLHLTVIHGLVVYQNKNDVNTVTGGLAVIGDITSTTNGVL
jgi:hypothetical protein